MKCIVQEPVEPLEDFSGEKLHARTNKYARDISTNTITMDK
jgi:hypothetical protein